MHYTLPCCCQEVLRARAILFSLPTWLFTSQSFKARTCLSNCLGIRMVESGCACGGKELRVKKTKGNFQFTHQDDPWQGSMATAIRIQKQERPDYPSNHIVRCNNPIFIKLTRHTQNTKGTIHPKAERSLKESFMKSGMMNVKRYFKRKYNTQGSTYVDTQILYKNTSYSKYTMEVQT